MLKNLKSLYAYRSILRDMSLARLKTKYSGSILGFSWAVLNPLLITLAITFVFYIVFKTEISGFPLFALSGILPWMFFSASLSEAADSILAQQAILRQFNFSREILPLSSVLSNFLNFLIGWVVMYPLFLYFNHGIIFFFPLLFLVILLELIFVCGLCLAISVLNVFLRDIGNLLGVLLMFWFWVTPIFYSSQMVPQKFQWVLALNPMTAYVNCYRELVFAARMPEWGNLWQAAVWAAVSLTAGFLIFSSLESKLLKKI